MINEDWHRSNILQCGLAHDFGLSDAFRGILTRVDAHNIFNPSFQITDTATIFAFRAIVTGETALSAFISIEDENGFSVTRLASASYPGLSAPRFIDPKVFLLDKDAYVTFNSGWVPGGNDIFVMQIHPLFGKPAVLRYKSRRSQERNWCIFSWNGETYVLYWINPLKILRVVRKSPSVWELEDHYESENPNPDLPLDLTLGTQGVVAGNKLIFISHQKRRLEGKKIYLGRLCTLDLENFLVRPGKYWLCHTFDSILGSHIKHNTNLYSCTYFSGIQVSGNRTQLAYGINDVHYGFSTHDLDDLL